MEDILLSQKQYQALLSRLDEINSDVTLIKFKTGQETAFIDNYNLSKLLQVSNRTLQRWRKNGRLPYLQLGKKVYYRADVILDSFKARKNNVNLDCLKVHLDNVSLDDLNVHPDNVILGDLNVRPDNVVEIDYPQPENSNQTDEEEEMACKRCPLYLILNSKG